MHYSQTADNLVEGTEIAGYIIDEKIGKGGMGSVYRAKHLALGRDVALKVLSEDFCRDERAVESFFKEARSVANLRHKNIIQAYDVGTSETGLHYFAMELVEGKNLNDIIHDFDKVPEDYAISIAVDMAAALKNAWQRNSLSHGDIKPENIMYTFNREVKITDFGLARSLHDESDDEVMLTPAYAAPELISRATTRISPSTDIYSFGISLYHMLAGHPPFQGEDYQEIYKKHLNEKAPPLSSLGVSKHLSNFVEALIQKDPHDRLNDWDDLLEELERIQSAPEGQPLYLKLGKVAAIIALPLIVFGVVWFRGQKKTDQTVVQDLMPEVSAVDLSNKSLTTPGILEKPSGDTAKSLDETKAAIALKNAQIKANLSKVRAAKVKSQNAAPKKSVNKAVSSKAVPKKTVKKAVSKKPVAKKSSQKAKLSKSVKSKATPKAIDPKELALQQQKQREQVQKARAMQFSKLKDQASLSYQYYSRLDSVFRQTGLSHRLKRLTTVVESFNIKDPYPQEIRKRIMFLSAKAKKVESSYRLCMLNRKALVGLELKEKSLDGYAVKSVSKKSIKLTKTVENSSTGGGGVRSVRIGKSVAWTKVSDDLMVELLVAVRERSSDLDQLTKDTIWLKIFLSGRRQAFMKVSSHEHIADTAMWHGVYYDRKRCDDELKYGKEWSRILELSDEGYKAAALRKLNKFETEIVNSYYFVRNKKMLAFMKQKLGGNKQLSKR